MIEPVNPTLKAAVLWTTLAAATLPAIGCVSEAEIAKQAAAERAAATLRADQERIDFERQVSRVTENATGLIRDTAYVLNLKMAKEQFTLNPLRAAGNELKAQYRDTLVGKAEYDKHNTGDLLSSNSDVLGYFSKGGAFASYTVRVHEKQKIEQCAYIDHAGNREEISPKVFEAALESIQSSGKTLYVSHSDNRTGWLIRERPISPGDIDHVTPLNRFFAEVHIENSSFSLSLTKHLRNAMTEHSLTLEISEQAFLEKSDIFDTKTSDSFLLSGRLSSLSGTIVKKWSERDDEHLKVTLKDGSEIVMNKSAVPTE